MRKRAMEEELTIKKRDWVRVDHKKKSDGVRVRHKKERWGESSL